MCLLKYLYYKLYKFSLRTEKQWASAHQIVGWTALHGLLVLFILNTVSVLILFSNKVRGTSLNILHAVFLVIILYLLGYYVFIKEKKYLKIENKFDEIDRSKKKILDALFWIYLILTFLVMFIIIPIMIPRNY